MKTKIFVCFSSFRQVQHSDKINFSFTIAGKDYKGRMYQHTQTLSTEKFDLQ